MEANFICMHLKRCFCRESDVHFRKLNSKFFFELFFCLGKLIFSKLSSDFHLCWCAYQSLLIFKHSYMCVTNSAPQRGFFLGFFFGDNYIMLSVFSFLHPTHFFLNMCSVDFQYPVPATSRSVNIFLS